MKDNTGEAAKDYAKFFRDVKVLRAYLAEAVDVMQPSELVMMMEFLLLKTAKGGLYGKK